MVASIGANSLGTVVPITPHDTNQIPISESRAVYIGVAGNLVCRCADSGVDVTLPLGVGWHPIAVQFIRATNTTCTNILAGR